jgi:hypothetical protein
METESFGFMHGLEPAGDQVAAGRVSAGCTVLTMKRPSGPASPHPGGRRKEGGNHEACPGEPFTLRGLPTQCLPWVLHCGNDYECSALGRRTLTSNPTDPGHGRHPCRCGAHPRIVQAIQTLLGMGEKGMNFWTGAVFGAWAGLIVFSTDLSAQAQLGSSWASCLLRF